MTKTKVTIKAADNKVYVSVEIAGYGKDDTNYSVAKVFGQLAAANFPSFNGTETEWTNILKTAQSTVVENLGTM